MCLGLPHSVVKLGHRTQRPDLPKRINTTPRPGKGQGTAAHVTGDSLARGHSKACSLPRHLALQRRPGEAEFRKRLKNHTTRDVWDGAPTKGTHMRRNKILREPGTS